MKNKNGTGNDAFRVHITGGSKGMYVIVEAFVRMTDEQLPEVVAKAKEAVKAMEGNGNERQKEWKTVAREFIRPRHRPR